ncbi:MAG: hypothetical protein RL885_03145 [Planctomycetota bacterium]
MRDPSNPKSSAAGVSQGERVRLMAMIVLLILVGGVFFKVIQKLPGNAPEEELPTEPERPMKVERHEVSSGLSEKLKDDIRDRTTEEMAVWEEEPYRRLLDSAGRLIDDDERFGRYADVSAEAIRANPDAYRGEAIQVQGELLDVREVVGDEVIEYRGHLRDDDGVVWTFATRRRTPNIEPGQRGWVKGFFYKLFWDTAPEGDTVYDRSPYIVGRTLQRGFETVEPPEELTPELFLDVREDSDPDTKIDHSRFLEPVPYQSLLGYVHQLSKEEKDALDYTEIQGLELLREPQEWRGEPVELFGRLQYLRQVYDPIPSIDQDYLYRGILINTKRKPEYVVFLEKPPVRQGDLVTVRGIFFKKYGYDTQGQTEQNAFNIAPLVVAVQTELFETPPDESMVYVTGAVALVVLIVTVLFIFFGLRERKRSEEMRKKFLEKKRTRRVF